MRENDLKGYKVKYKTKEEMFSALYAFLLRDDLTNPEVTFFTSKKDTGEAATLSFSRNGEYEGGGLPDERKWKELIGIPNLYGVLAVAATDKADLRRVAVFYSPSNGFGFSLVVTFPNALNGLNVAERRILDSLGACS